MYRMHLTIIVCGVTTNDHIMFILTEIGTHIKYPQSIPIRDNIASIDCGIGTIILFGDP